MGNSLDRHRQRSLTAEGITYQRELLTRGGWTRIPLDFTAPGRGVNHLQPVGQAQSVCFRPSGKPGMVSMFPSSYIGSGYVRNFFVGSVLPLGCTFHLAL